MIGFCSCSNSLIVFLFCLIRFPQLCVDNGDVHIGDVHIGDVHIVDVHIGDIHIGDVHIGDVHIGNIHIGNVHIGDQNLSKSVQIYNKTQKSKTSKQGFNPPSIISMGICKLIAMATVYCIVHRISYYC